MILNIIYNLGQITNNLFKKLKNYGAVKITEKDNMYVIHFDNEVLDSSSYSVLNKVIKSNDFNSVESDYPNPHVNEYLDTNTGTINVKLIQYYDYDDIDIVIKISNITE